MKFTGDLSKLAINQSTVIDYASMNNYTYYVSPMMVLGSTDYTKHYFIEGQLVMSKIGGGFADGLMDEMRSSPEGEDMMAKGEAITNQLYNTFECLSLTGNVDYFLDLDWLGGIAEQAVSEGQVYFYHPDHLGSSSFISDLEGGGPVQHLEYLPFGELFIEERSTWNTPYKFSGKELDDETGYSYFGARYYDPNISIWLTVDPLSDKAPGWTPYRYAFNNPLRITDPTGMIENLDGWEVNVETNEATWVSDQGGATEQHITYVNSAGERAPVGTEVIKGDGFSVENGRATSQRSDGSPFHSNYSRSANRPHLAQTNYKEQDPMIKFEATTEAGFAGGVTLKVFGFGGKTKLGVSWPLTSATYTEEGIETSKGGDGEFSAYFGRGPAELGGSINTRTGSPSAATALGPARYTQTLTRDDLRITVFDIGGMIGVGGNLRLSVSPNLLSGDTRR